MRTLYYVRTVRDGTPYVVPFGEDKEWVDQHGSSVLENFRKEDPEATWEEMPYDPYYDYSPNAVPFSIYCGVALKGADQE